MKPTMVSLVPGDAVGSEASQKATGSPLEGTCSLRREGSG